ncbi:MAG: hypothetical protein AAB354_08030 [candidate division KSB1 bacterium]
MSKPERTFVEKITAIAGAIAALGGVLAAATQFSDQVKALLGKLAENGRMLMTETSSQPKYDPTHHFYLKHHYREVARIPDFYAKGDDRVIYQKVFSS